MKLWLVLLHIILVGTNLWVTAHYQEELFEDNEFAEFEDFEDEKLTHKAASNQNHPSPQLKDVEKNAPYEEDDVSVEDGDNEFDHFQDEEEFEGVDGASADAKIDEKPKTLTITKLPPHLRTRWESFYLEILMLVGLLVYFVNYINGKTKNCHIADTFYNDHKQLLLDNFSLVGDNGRRGDEETTDGPIKESDSLYNIYCSGRVGCDSLLIELKLLKRQDLVSSLSQIIRPQNDQAHLRVELTKDEIDNFVLAVATKKTAIHFSKEMADINVYCPERKSGEKFNLPSGFFVMSEISEATSAILDAKVIQAFNKYHQYIDYIHISDQYSGLKQQEESTQLTMPEVKRVLLVGLNISLKGHLNESENQEKIRPLLQLTFYMLDKIRRFKLSKEGKSKTDKNRQKVEEAFLKTTHAARVEAAAARREEKRRVEKERILQEEDPDKQRKWEEKEQRRLAKKRAPKMKQLKVKAL
ncbi:hypothetical protein TKK_0006356 [Trichogramma kaykai]|uniref:PAT complex subunit CCDC47 n=1 Tax=Trichogramma kaykai TaxID=54128 RepID=A0ABD2XEA2_9HYME